MTQAIPPALAILLPLLVTPLAGWLSTDQFAPWINAIIAFIVICAAAVAWAIFVHALTGNIVDDLLLISGYISILIAGPLRPLYNDATLKLPSPLAVFAHAHAEAQAVFAAPITPVAMRASATPLREESPVKPQITLPAKPPPEHPPAAPGDA